MSGIVGILNFDGKPVDKSLLEDLTSSLVFRGPDRQAVWVSGNIGFGHTLLSTTDEAKREKHPVVLDVRFWLVSDARIDGRKELENKLKAKGCRIHGLLTDPELILHAYKAWGQACTQHLIGDFSFAIWDKQQKTLFCARDHFGVKPFFYAVFGNTLVFSNTFECVRKYPTSSSELNDQAITDFLLFGFNLDLSSTSIENIKRLPPARTIRWQKSIDALPECYWTLPVKEQIRYRHKNEYVEHFKELLHVAVADRLRADRVTVAMGGGLDSTSIAKTAYDIFTARGEPFGLHAFTGVYDNIIPDEERYFSKLAARAIGIPIKHISGDSYTLFQDFDQYKILTPDPLDNPYILLSLKTGEEIFKYSRVSLNGQGADEILVGDCLLDMLGKVPLKDLCKDTLSSVFQYKQRPALGVRRKLQRFNVLNSNTTIPDFPGWLNPDITNNLQLRRRWTEFWASRAGQGIGMRPTAYHRLSPGNYWPPYLEGFDPGITGVQVETRWPFLDVRLISDLLSFPAMPWFVNKLVLREAMKDLLPETIRLRPKTPLAGHVYLEHLQKRKTILSEKDIEEIFKMPKMRKYVNYSEVKTLCSKKLEDIDPNEAWLLLMPVLLCHWFKRAH